MEPVRFVVYSDFLCPWCYNATVRLHRLEDEFGPRVELRWRSHLLRPRPRPRDLEKFRAYTRSWERPAQEADAGTFRVWEGDAGPPSHSLPPHQVAKAAAALGPGAARQMRIRLLEAYFTENRDISDRATLTALWAELDLPAGAFAAPDATEIVQEVLRDDSEGRAFGVTGVPSVHLEGNDAIILGAQPYATYQRWTERMLAR